ncbi:Cysteine--tRNA ligase [Buchnera aphidicola (Cinara piceae)]|uniref:Cysteine--tRNA ligase n=1 Tax=Buchnera aphidicola (Cinara piceae) TaxID=1660043 RepID=A0A803GCU8_9GAMM|nr:cysteine--tRNA ligase [Buchnera aphidicola]VFP88639.1 Cysteine--tRNA ligase [Buchnera aphidicola (Cinara piceae)]
MLKIFNTLTKKKEIFEYSFTKRINIYVCGVTVYDLCHIGHARTFIIFDVIIRYLQNLGYNTYYIRNITDIDDKIINRAKKKKESVSFFVKRMIKLMHEDFLCLNLLFPNQEPRVTECISDIIFLIDSLLKKNYAYIACNNDILFPISQYKNYGSLSRRINNCCFHDNKNNNNLNFESSKDFVLWKHSSNHVDPFWFSPWGPGRPGWHIECSAIINKFFKHEVNIHGGGIDLLFPHHENEFAQLKSFKDYFSVQFWMHAGMVILNNYKMSKSLSNTITIRSLLKKYDSEVIRLYFLSTHYRHPLYFLEKNLCLFKNILEKIYISLLNCITDMYIQTDYEIKLRNMFKDKFYHAMNDDFNTPQACLVLQKLSQYITKIKNSNIYLANILATDLVKLGNVLGLLYHNPKDFLSNRYYIPDGQINIIDNLVKMRNFYRLNKQWNLADIVRKKLFTLGVIIEDNLNHSTYRFIN